MGKEEESKRPKFGSERQNVSDLQRQHLKKGDDRVLVRNVHTKISRLDVEHRHVHMSTCDWVGGDCAGARCPAMCAPMWAS